MTTIFENDDVVTTARKWLGTPYMHQASTMQQGCDCLGLIRGVWRTLLGAEPQVVPGYSPDWGEASQKETMLQAAREHFIEIDKNTAMPGAVLIFRWHPNFVAKHAGILSSQHTFIHAYDRSGVVENSLGVGWKRRIEAAFYFPKTPAQSINS